jgi:hypothetical protein
VFDDGYQHRRHAFYRGLIESEKPLEPEFDDEVSLNPPWRHHKLIDQNTRDTTRFILQTPRKTLNVNEFAKLYWVDWPVEDLNPCFVLFLGKEENWRDVWPLVLNMLRRHMRYVYFLLIFQAHSQVGRWWTLSWHRYSWREQQFLEKLQGFI